jgi:hypothetical protein
MKTIQRFEKEGLQIRLVEADAGPGFFIVSEHTLIPVIGLAYLGKGLMAATRTFIERCRAAERKYDSERESAA